MNFMNSLKETKNNEKQLTENGAVGYRTTGKELLDLNFALSSLRHEPKESIKDRFAKAYFENPMLAMKWLFKAGDVRCGDGERRTFRVCCDWLAENKIEVLRAILNLIPEYTRWDNLLRLINVPEVSHDVTNIANRQVVNDLINIKNGKPISLIGKWLYSENCSNADNKKMASMFRNAFGLSPKMYRKTLTTLRSYLNVVESKMCRNEWDKIDYEAVPSKANLKYADAFLCRDYERRKQYLEDLKNGNTKINSSVCFPHDIVYKYLSKRNVETTLEEMWKSLPDYTKQDSNTLVVFDGSGSMYSNSIGNTNIRPIDVSIALAIYIAERLTGQFHNQCITFGSFTSLMDFSNCSTLLDKIKLAKKNTDCGTTNIYKVFKLILDTAISKNMKQEDMPKRVLILSDMEFNNRYGLCFVESEIGHYSCNNLNSYDKTLFENIEREFNAHGYKLPKLVFWNLASRTNTIPLKESENGIALVSGFSPTTLNMVMSDKLDPYEILLEQLNSERYDMVETILKDVI